MITSWKSTPLALAIAVTLLLPACGTQPSEQSGAEKEDLKGEKGVETASDAVKAGMPAPDFELATLEGETRHLAAMKGEKVVLLVLWAVWCPPCIEEVPLLNELHAKYADQGLEILALGVPHGQDEKAIRGFLKRNDVRYTILFDAEDQVSPRYGALFVPHNYLIGADGTLDYEGTVMPKDLEERVQRLLAEIPAASADRSAVTASN
jgi:peroxiredoxin